MAEKKEILLKSLDTLLQYPKSATLRVNHWHYDDYKHLHQSYIRAYKKLHEDVAAFSVLPEQFMQQAEPVIEKYLADYNLTAGSEQKEWLQAITDFINGFYEFMDEANEMFAGHQSLSDETLAYLQKKATIEAKFKDKHSQGFIPLIPELQNLANSLKVVREAVDATAANLADLVPAWKTIKEKINK